MAEVATPYVTRIVLVTGPSGAGRTTAMRALEDIGFEAIDNLPFRMVDALLTEGSDGGPIALGFDARNRDFSTGAMMDTVAALRARPDVEPHLLYLDCAKEVLLRRFSETRRRHPLAPAESPEEGIEREFDVLAPLRNVADVLIDTSEMSPHDLRAEVDRWFRPSEARGLGISLQSFSYKRGMPRGLDMVFDVRFLRNPYWEPELRALDGRSDDVASYIADDPRYAHFFSDVTRLVGNLLPAYVEEGKSHLSIGFGCTGGQHRSVALAERLADALADQGWQVSKRHRELERRSPRPRPSSEG